MFKLSDNPQLFYVISKKYKQMFPEDKNFAYYQQDYFTDEQCLKVTELVLTSSDFYGALSLAGIENFPNLEVLSVEAQTQQQEAKFLAKRIDDGKIRSENELKCELERIQNGRNNSQVYDINHIYGCKKLKQLNLHHQINITSLDLSQLPNLEYVNMFNCRKLAKIKGLNDLRVFQADNDIQTYDSCYFDFSGCDALEDVEDFDKYINACLKINSENNECHLFLPTTTYLYLARKNKSIVTDLYNAMCSGSDFVLWTETSPLNNGVTFDSEYMRFMKIDLDTILKGLVKEEEKSVVKVSNMYRWICDNIKKSAMANKGLRDIVNSDNPTFATSIETLNNEEIDAIGVNQLFNMFMANMGFSYGRVNGYKFEEIDGTPQVVYRPISKVFVANRPYFCDIVSDLESEKSKHFCLTKREMLYRCPLVVSSSDKSGDSIQQQLKAGGYLKTDHSIGYNQLNLLNYLESDEEQHKN